MNSLNPINRRDFATSVAATATALALPVGMSKAKADDAPLEEPFKLNYLLASAMYGHVWLGDILPEVTKTGATAIDLWPRKHGSQREQLGALGIDAYRQLISEHGVTTGCITRFDLGKPDRQDDLMEELELAGKLGCDCLVTSGHGPRDLKGAELKSAIVDFIKTLRPVIEVAEENGVRLAIENHGKNLIESPDSLKYLAELSPSPNLAIAFAPYHLTQDTKMLSELITSLGPAIALFYAWEHGMGCMKKLPKDQELMQLPGRGQLDFRPLLAALKKTKFAGWTEIFMHPVPRGIPIAPTEKLVTAEINASRHYLNETLRELEI